MLEASASDFGSLRLGSLRWTLEAFGWEASASDFGSLRLGSLRWTLEAFGWEASASDFGGGPRAYGWPDCGLLGSRAGQKSAVLPGWF